VHLLYWKLNHLRALLQKECDVVKGEEDFANDMHLTMAAREEVAKKNPADTHCYEVHNFNARSRTRRVCQVALDLVLTPCLEVSLQDGEQEGGQDAWACRW
jgi:hypothetical protein